MPDFEPTVNNRLPTTETASCTDSACEKSIRLHMWGKAEAYAEGWFFQKNGDLWCPDHLPDWVSKWRAKKKAEMDQKDDIQLTVKKAVKRSGLNVGFCNFCLMLECTPGLPTNNWVMTGCRCCHLNHDLVGG